MKISKEFDAIVGFAREEAMRTGSYSIEADHLFLGILRHGGNSAVDALRSYGIDTAGCKSEIDSFIFREQGIPYGHEDEVRLGREGSNTVSMAIAEAMSEGAEETGAIHLLKAICKQQACRSSEYLRRHGFSGQNLGRAGGAEKKQEESSGALGKKEIAILLSTINLNTNKTIVS